MNDSPQQSFTKKVWNYLFVNKANMWIAIFTCVFTLFTGLLAYIAHETDETNKVSQRAFISYQGTGGSKILTQDGSAIASVQVLVLWQNGGNTPTRTAFTRVNWQPFFPDLPDNFAFHDIGDAETRPFVVGPKASSTIAIVVPISAFSDAKERKNRLFMWGWTTYRDSFKKSPPRLTEFCSEIVNIGSTKPSLTDPTGELTWQATTCKTHNCYDEDCEDYQSKTSQKPN